MPIFNTKRNIKVAAQQAASIYNIKYSKDGSSYSIYDKEGLSDTPGRSDEMLRANQSPIGRRKERLFNRYFQIEAEKDKLKQTKKQIADDKAAKLLLQKQLEDEKNKTKSGPGTKGPGTGGPDDIATEMPFNYNQFKTSNFDLSSDSKTLFPSVTSDITSILTTNKDQIDPSKIGGVEGMIQSSDIYDITSLNPFSNFSGISHADFIKAKNEGKSYLVKDNEVYNVEQNLMSYESRPDSWSARETDDYYRTQAIGNTLGGMRNMPLTLTKGKRNKWFELPNLLEQVSLTGAPIKGYGRILKELGPTLSKLIVKMNKTDPKKAIKLLETNKKALEKSPEIFKKVVKNTKEILMPKKRVFKQVKDKTKTFKQVIDKTKKSKQVKNSSFSKIIKKQSGKLISR